MDDVANPLRRDVASVKPTGTNRSTLTRDQGALGLRLEGHRRELGAYCRRMLGSPFEAEDAVQETLVRAWRNFDRFEGRAALRSWLYRIATNVCLDMLRTRQRRPLTVDLEAPATRSHPGAGLPAGGIGSVLDGGAPPRDPDPADAAVSREMVRLAFVAALRHLPPRQRAILILRDVLRWRADEVAELLGCTVTSVNSALQRARATLAGRDVDASDPSEPLDAADRTLVAGYVDAFERCDVETLVSLLSP